MSEMPDQPVRSASPEHNAAMGPQCSFKEWDHGWQQCKLDEGHSGAHRCTGTRSAATPNHWLVITEDGERDWQIEHEGCAEHRTHYGAMVLVEYECGVGDLVAGAGADAIPELDDLPVGRHPIAVHVEHTPSLPTNGGEEWDAWIEVVR